MLGSCKRWDALRNAQFVQIEEALDMGELRSGQGLNQETSLKRDSDTRLGLHYDTILNLIVIFSTSIHVLEIIQEDGTNFDKKRWRSIYYEVNHIFWIFLCFKLDEKYFGDHKWVVNSIDKKTQNIVNAITLVNMSKQQLQMMRDNE